MLRDKVTVSEAVLMLNEALVRDREAITKLVLNGRQDCNEMLAHHPTIQCAKIGENYQIGILGILNGLFGVSPDDSCGIPKGFGMITMIVEDGVIRKFATTSSSLNFNANEELKNKD